MPTQLSEMAAYLQKLLPPSIPANYEIAAMFTEELKENEIRSGVPAFRDFLYLLYARVVEEGDAFVPPPSNEKAGKDSHHADYPAAYKFMRNLMIVLSNLGLLGTFNGTRDALHLKNDDCFTFSNRLSYVKMPNKRKMQCLQLLMDCGVQIEGLDLQSKTPATRTPLTITYPRDPKMLAGLKVMTLAQDKVGTKYQDEILHRCDYTALANKKPDPLAMLQTLLSAAPAEARDFMLALHQSYVAHGFKCNTYIGYSTRYEYFCRSKELWRFNMTSNKGAFITIKAANTDKYPKLVQQLPMHLQECVTTGYGCGKKMGLTDHCDSGCRGYFIPLDASIAEVGGVVRAWIEAEVACIRGK
ncbi:MAG: hypothetical protein FWC71_04115 [Defluviitaleaceae bacterium]|nr:hypothetical protein [Defluviitaleaceae bacterium]